MPASLHYGLETDRRSGRRLPTMRWTRHSPRASVQLGWDRHMPRPLG
jgi:hypothetical protein